MDLHSVPRNHLRYISWIAYVIARDPRHGIRESIAVANSPHSNYYIQDGIDMGAMMDTNLSVAKVGQCTVQHIPKHKLTYTNKDRLCTKPVCLRCGGFDGAPLNANTASSKT